MSNFIEEVVTEGNLESDLADLLSNHGWTKQLEFHKVCYPSNWLYTHTETTDAGNVTTTTWDSDREVSFQIFKHTIYQSPKGLYYGLARKGEIKMQWGQIPHRPSEGTSDSKDFAEWAVQFYEEVREYATWYMYMCEELPSTEDGGIEVIPWPDDVKGGIDIEVTNVTVESEAIEDSDGNLTGYSNWEEIIESKPEVMQSPFVRANTRVPEIETYDYEHLYVEEDEETDFNTGSIVQEHNWWPDSEVLIRGNIDDEGNAFLIIQADRAAAPNDNLVPNIPFFWGELDSVGDDDDRKHILFAGSATEEINANYDYHSLDPEIDLLEEERYLPILKRYKRHPSSGIDTVMVHRKKHGSRYQAHYISWNTPHDDIPPDRELDGKQYYSGYTNPEGKLDHYRFNTSRYSNHIHTSVGYVIHPHEGVRGSLPHAILSSPLNLMEMDKLRVRSKYCEDGSKAQVYDYYRYFNVESISPFTKRPGTVYRPAGVAIFEETKEDE